MKRLNNNEDNIINFNENQESSSIFTYEKSDDNVFVSKTNNYDKNIETEGIYSDIKDNANEKCHKNCKYCYDEGNETINNCIECIDNLRFYNESI